MSMEQEKFRRILAEMFEKQVDYGVLEQQRKLLVNLLYQKQLSDEENVLLDGLFNLVDEVMDLAIDRQVCSKDEDGVVASTHMGDAINAG